MSETPVTVPFVSFRPMERELDADLRGAFARVLDNSWYIGGREDAAFEKAFADYCGVRHCVGCGNGLDALVLILKALGKSEELITFVKDRPGHDRRYAIDPTKIHNELGWLPQTKFEDGIVKTIDWYLANKDWWQEIISGEYQNYYKMMYMGR